MTTEFLLTGVLLPLVLIAVAVGLARIEEDLSTIAPRPRSQGPAVDDREES